ncbi:MAG: DUF4394 domain-containing protein [Burkholderiaceae bacterium]|nr:DUF4394 domain-containing protein [Burkholderiaceae bacterium]
MRRSMLQLSAAAAAAAALLAACGGSDYDDLAPAPVPAPAPAPSPVPVGDTIALTNSGKLISFNRATPATLVGSVSVSGLAANETLLGIDHRPADGKLYALGSAGNVYTIEPSSGVATLKVALKAAAGDDDPFAALAGSDFALDFNPVADRLRVVSNVGQNLRINVDTGDAITDGLISLAGGVPHVTAAGYTNAFLGTTATQLFDLDAAAGLLHLQDPPNNGTLAAGLALGVTGAQVNGFDIDGRNNTGYAALTVGGTTNLYRVNVTSGAANALGAIAGGEMVRGLALQQPAGPTVLGLTAANQLVAFDPKAPNTLTGTTPISGLGTGETVVGIDVRPKDGALYALTDGGKVYTVDPASGAATLKATLVADPADTSSPFTALSGTAFSVDFNPQADRMRVIGDSGQNLRVNVDTGNTFTDGTISRTGTAPMVIASAYTNSFDGAPSTMLFNLDAASDVLTLQAPPNDGTLANVGALGLDISGMAGFDIAGGANGLALAALRSGASGPFTLYSVSLASGAATLYRNTSGNAALNQIGGANGPVLLDIAIRF